MVKYNCKLCNYETIIKTHYNRHLNTKKHKNKEENNEAKEKKV